MTIREFITEQADIRAQAAKELTEPLEINGIEISAGCTKDGIELRGGIEKLADVLGTEILTQDEELTYDTGRFKRTSSFIFNGTVFYEYRYIEKQVKADV